jgi:NAD+ kinase
LGLKPGNAVNRSVEPDPRDQGVSASGPIGVVVKASHPRAKELTLQLLKWFQERKVDYRIEDAAAQTWGLKLDGDHAIERAQLCTTCPIIVVLGGDGTLISACRCSSYSSPIIVGVNLGTLGFLTEITIEEMFPALNSLLNGVAAFSTRHMLDAVHTRGGEELGRFVAMNDIVVSKRALARIFGVSFSVDGTFGADVHGDGLIVSTPGGSTAYSLAAGGSIVHPDVGAILITPICPHSLTSRPLVIPGNSRVSLTVSKALVEDEVYLTVDGQEGSSLRTGDRIEVTTSSRSVRFVQSTSRNYFQLLATKLKWGNT